MNRAGEAEFSPDAIRRIHLCIECDGQCNTSAIAERQPCMLGWGAQSSGCFGLIFGEWNDLLNGEAYLGQRGESVLTALGENGVRFGECDRTDHRVENNGSHNIGSGFFVKQGNNAGVVQNNGLIHVRLRRVVRRLAHQQASGRPPGEDASVPGLA